MEKFIVTLTPTERLQLEACVAKGTHSAAKLINALILLNCDVVAVDRGERRSSEDIAQVLHISARKIDRIKRRFVEEGFAAALERKPSTREYERVADGEVEAHLVALSCSPPPQGHAQWSLRLNSWTTSPSSIHWPNA